MAAHDNSIPAWTWIAPTVAGALYAAHYATHHWLLDAAIAAALIGAVLAAVHHAETVAHRIGEPFGTLVLACAVTIIEVALIVALMLASGETSSALARDTVFAGVMIILNGIVGICLLVGGSRHREQSFGLRGVSASLATLAALLALTLILPNYTTTTPGPVYAASQLGFVAAVSLVLYGAFVLVQTVRHRDYFLPAGPAAGNADLHAPPPPARLAVISAILLPICLIAVVLLAKTLAPTMEAALDSAGAPKAVIGVVIAAIVLLPEGLAALRAAAANRLQTSLNLALGSAIATIGLTIPTVAIVSLITGWTLILGLDIKDMVLLTLTLFVATLSLGTGRTTILQGVVHLVIFAVYLFTVVVP
jgi:Ca2+:H+ antiporter